MNETLETSILCMVGLLIHYTKEWAIANNQDKKYNFKKAIPMALLSAITTLTLVYLRDDLKDIYLIKGFGAVVLGYLGNSVFFSFVDVKKPKFSNDTPPDNS